MKKKFPLHTKIFIGLLVGASLGFKMETKRNEK